MHGANEHKRLTLLAFSGSVGAVAALTGILVQIPLLPSALSIDPGLIPFLLLLTIGFLTAIIASVGLATIAGMFSGFVLALSGSFYCVLSHTCTGDTIRTFVAFALLMIFFGALFAFLGAIPVWLWRERKLDIWLPPMDSSDPR